MKIGELEIPDNSLFLAPMHEVTDIPFRVICKSLGADVVVSEFVSVEALVREVEKAKKKMFIHPKERPIGIQIFGKNIASFERAIPVVESFKPDFIDINAGCSVGKHASRGECAGLLRDLPHFKKIVQMTVRATKIPVTVKTRLGWDMNSIVIEDVAKMIQDEGVKALTLHCRTKKHSYKDPADWSWLEKIKKVLSIPLIGNGDIFQEKDVKAMFQTGCDAVMIGRGAITNPWIFQESKYFLEKGKEQAPITWSERLETCLKHLKLYFYYNNHYSKLYAFRKFYSGYLKGMPGVSRLRKELMRLEIYDEILSTLKKHQNEDMKHYDPNRFSQSIIT